MKKRAILFDYGNTLVSYFESHTPTVILEESVAKAEEYLRDLNLLHISRGDVWQAVKEEATEAADHRVRPMVNRLCRIFQIKASDLPDESETTLCRRFIAPMFKIGKCYDDTIPVLDLLKKKGIKTAIVSNAPWGCPAPLCREEVARLDIARFMDDIIFCTDVGWRKPSKQIFEHTVNCLQVPLEQCLFIGDHPEWDFDGPRSMGMDTLFIDRNDTRRIPEEFTIKSLDAILNWLD